MGQKKNGKLEGKDSYKGSEKKKKRITGRFKKALRVTMVSVHKLEFGISFS